jgi:hypothetical protein
MSRQHWSVASAIWPVQLGHMAPLAPTTLVLHQSHVVPAISHPCLKTAESEFKSISSASLNLGPWGPWVLRLGV